MKEIRAYVRTCRVKAAVNALQQAGAPGITVVEVHPVGYAYESNYFEPDLTDVMKRYQYLANRQAGSCLHGRKSRQVCSGNPRRVPHRRAR